MSKIKVLRLTPHDSLEEVEIENSLKALQKEVDGYIEALPIGDNFAIIVNEEGKIIGLPLSLVLVKNGKMVDQIVGNVIFCKTKDGGFKSLSKKDIEAFKGNFKLNTFRALDI